MHYSHKTKHQVLSGVLALILSLSLLLPTIPTVWADEAADPETVIESVTDQLAAAGETTTPDQGRRAEHLADEQEDSAVHYGELHARRGERHDLPLPELQQRLLLGQRPQRPAQQRRFVPRRVRLFQPDRQTRRDGARLRGREDCPLRQLPHHAGDL